MKDILVLAEHRNGQLLPVTAEMLSLARELADHDGGGITMVIMDQAPLEMARSSAETFGVDVLAVGGDHFETYNPEVFLEVLAGIGEDRPAPVHSGRPYHHRDGLNPGPGGPVESRPGHRRRGGSLEGRPPSVCPGHVRRKNRSPFHVSSPDHHPDGHARNLQDNGPRRSARQRAVPGIPGPAETGPGKGRVGRPG